MQSLDEAELLQKAKEYDQAALGALYDAYSQRIFNYIYRRLGNVSLAEDLTATVFLRMLEAVRTSKAWHKSFSGWLYRIAHNLIVDHFRSGRQDKDVALDGQPLASDDRPSESAERSLTNIRLREAVAQLTEEQGIVITLKFMEGMSNAEVGKLIGKSEGAVKSLQFRALAALRRTLEEEIL